MNSKHLCLLLLTVTAYALAQNDDELRIPMENDNQFPPENHSESDGNIIEGSGLGAIEEPIDATTTPAPPPIEEEQLTSLLENEEGVSESGGLSCPKPCVCNVEGDTSNYIVDCSGYGLSQFPTQIDVKTTKLNLQNNKLTEIPKDISSLKNLKELNVNDNLIMDIASGSISELPELMTLSLANNRLIEYPKDLKNSFGLINLQDLNLGGNDMRTPMTTENFSIFKSLRKLTLPTTSSDLLEDLCISLKASLETVCTGSCKDKLIECPDISPALDDELLEATLPGTIAISSVLEDSADPILNAKNSAPIDADADDKDINEIVQTTNELVKEVLPKNVTSTSVPKEESEKTETTNLHTLLKSEVIDKVTQFNTIVEAPKDETAKNSETDVNVGATTSSTKTGGVDSSIIAVIIAGMILVVAGITIKKNWSSIRNRFSSNQRPPNDRTPVHTNGTTPEEMPLQEKSPV